MLKNCAPICKCVHTCVSIYCIVPDILCSSASFVKLGIVDYRENPAPVVSYHSSAHSYNFVLLAFWRRMQSFFLSYTVKNKNPVQSSQNTITYICFIQKAARILHENVYVYVQFFSHFFIHHMMYCVGCGCQYIVPIHSLKVKHKHYALCSKCQQINCRCILIAPMYFASTRE